MAFGNQLFQLAQGIIANEQQRKQLELKEEQQDIQIKQAERTFAARERETSAREGFLKLQQDQLALKQQQATSPEAQKTRELEVKMMEAQIADLNARTVERTSGKGQSASVDQVIRMGDRALKIDNDARMARTNSVLAGLLNGEDAPPSVDGDKILEGTEALGISTFDGLLAAKKNSQEELEALAASPGAGTTFIQDRITAMTKKHESLVQAESEARKVFSPSATHGEFTKASPFPQAFTNSMFRNGGSVKSTKMAIWGEDIFASNTNQALDIGIARLRDKNDMNVLRNFIQTFPGKLLDSEGRMTEAGQSQLGGILFNEGVPAETAQEFFRTFNPFLQPGGRPPSTF
jgi:hypothetical protein